MRIFSLKEKIEHFTTGFPQLDQALNNGGPSRGEVLIWVAPTGIGKSIMLINNGATLVKLDKKVLHITLELSKEVTQARYMGAMLNQPILFSERKRNQANITSQLSRIREEFGSNLVIYDFPADEVSVDVIYQIVDFLEKTKGFKPDAIIIDYLELMVSRRPSDNRDDYTRQKRVSTQVHGLAKKTKTLVFSASQTNRSGTSAGMERDSADVIDLNRIAESYGKVMPVDYVVTLNQTRSEYVGDDDDNLTKRGIRLYVAKNRNGPRCVQVRCEVDYMTMKMKQTSIVPEI